jgi:hypothetical protein
MGVREQIKHSNSRQEIDELLKLSKTFEFASPFTKRAWLSTAKIRITQLESNDSAQEPKQPIKSEKKKSKR